MRPSFYEEAVNPYGFGFHAAPIPANDPDFLSDPVAPHWTRWQQIFDAARQGEFQRTPALIELFGHYEETLEGAASYLIGFAGSDDCLEQVLDFVRKPPFLTTHVDMCEALALTGRLAYVPQIVETYMGLLEAGRPDLEVIPIRLRYLLGDPDGVLGDDKPAQEFRKNALARCQALIERFGSDQVSVFQGETVTPQSCAERMLSDAKSGNGLMIAPQRLILEAYTGFDCSGCFENSSVQLLGAAAVAEEFLSRSDAAGFETGARYFFGHRVEG